MEESKETRELRLLYEEIKQHYLHRELQMVLEKSDLLYLKAKTLGSINFIIKSISFRGRYYFNLNKLPLAISCFEESQIILEKTHRINNLISVKSSLGILYSNNGEHTKALNILIKALEISEKYKIIKSLIYNNIGIVYLAKNEYDKSLQFLRKAIKVEENSKKSDDILITRYLVNVATVYLKLSRIEEAEKIYLKTIKTCEKNKDYEFLITSIKGLSKLWLDKNQTEKTEQILKRGLDLGKIVNYNIHIVDFSLYLAELYRKTKRNELRRKHLFKALEISKNSNKAKVNLVLEHLVDYYKDNNNIKQAFKTIKKLDALQSKYFFKEEKEKLIELQESFDLQQKEKLIQQERDHVQELILKNEKLEESLNQQKNIELQLKSLQLQLSPHFIFNSLQSIQSYIFQKDVVLASDYLAKFARLMRAILLASKKEAITLEEEEAILRDYLDLERERFSNAFSYEILFENIADKRKVRMPLMLIQIFIENAILHGVKGKENGRILILFREKGGQIFVHVIDNGKGYYPPVLKEEKSNYKESLALKILKERKVLSLKSKNFSYNFKIWNRKRKEGTHVAVQIIDQKRN